MSLGESVVPGVTAGRSNLAEAAVRRLRLWDVPQAQIDQVAAFAILALVASMFRPAGVVLWRLPRSGWFIVMAGVGFLLGVVIYLLLRNVRSRTEEISLVIGGIAIALAGLGTATALAKRAGVSDPSATFAGDAEYLGATDTTTVSR